MKQSNAALIDEVIDKLTNSIEHVGSGMSFRTELIPMHSGDRTYRKTNWRFDWRSECKMDDRRVYKLVTADDPLEIHGLISMADNHDHVLIHLVESAKFNQGKAKRFSGVAGNLFAFACKRSLELGYDGFVSFFAKSKLVGHYEQQLGAERLIGDQMVIRTRAGNMLIEKYFSDRGYEQKS
ncbi:MAG: hypothetical protein U0176_22230 [Bacteroidia bacterium]